MLVLGRQVGERIVIQIPPSTQDRTITVTLLERRYERVRLGFVAPADIIIDREEVADERNASE